MIKKIQALTIALCCWFICSMAMAQGSPVQVVETAANHLLDSLAHAKSKNQLSDQNISRMVDQILVPVIDVGKMSALVLGRNVWMSATQEQKNNFIAEFKRLVISTYSGALASYDDDHMRFYPIRGAASGKARVRSIIVRKNGQTIPIEYDLVEENGTWKIYDFSIENVSMISSYRSQFASALSSAGLNGLLDELRRHNGRS